MEDHKQRIIQEHVPGRQVTLAHLIASPQRTLFHNLGLGDRQASAIGILTITPSEGVIIAADIATKAAAVEVVCPSPAIMPNVTPAHKTVTPASISTA